MSEAISIHSPHARGDISQYQYTPAATISIHSPHARGDVLGLLSRAKRKRISIHSPHARGDVAAGTVTL